MQPISTTLLILGSQHSSPIKRCPLPFTASPSQPPFYSLFSKFEDSLSHILRCVYLFIYPWTLRLKLSADEWTRKLWYIYTMDYSAIKKNSFESVLMRWMKLEPIIQSEVSQKDKDHYNILTHIYGI